MVLVQKFELKLRFSRVGSSFEIGQEKGRNEGLMRKKKVGEEGVSGRR